MSRLRLIGRDAKPAIPVLLAAIEFGERDVWIRAVAAAGDLGATPEELVPRLRQKLTLDEESRVTAATRILSMHPADAESQSVLVREIGKDPRSEWRAIFALGRAGTNAQNAIVPVMRAFDGTNVPSWTSAADALRSMGALDDTYLPRLREKLRPGAEFDRLLVAKKLLEIDPQDRDALNAVLDIVRRPSKYQRYAVDILADVGPPARHAIPILQQVLRDGDEGIQFAAKRALRIIKGSKLPPSSG